MLESDTVTVGLPFTTLKGLLPKADAVAAELLAKVAANEAGCASATTDTALAASGSIKVD